jgi:hypothetical protein
MEIWGRTWTRAELMKRVGILSQLGGITHFEYCDGKAKGVTCLRVHTAAGLEFCVLPERGLDIFEASYQGKSLAWHSPVGLVHPAYYDCRDIQWLKTFPGGLLATCGLTNAGSPSDDDGEALGLHGSISNTPAEHVLWRQEWEDDELLLTIQGSVREARVFGPNLVMNRTIQTSLSGRSIKLRDVICNEGYQDTPLMLVYHLNFGFPLLTERSRIYGNSLAVEGRTEIAKSHLADWNVFAAPTEGIAETVYYHSFQPDEDGNVTVILVSDRAKPDFGLELTYPKAVLPQFVEWKMPGATHYVLGLEPANCRVDGRKTERVSGRLQFLPPGGKQKFGFELRVLDGLAEVEAAIDRSTYAKR